jgi:hypothetical protein
MNDIKSGKILKFPAPALTKAEETEETKRESVSEFIKRMSAKFGLGEDDAKAIYIEYKEIHTTIFSPLDMMREFPGLDESQAKTVNREINRSIKQHEEKMSKVAFAIIGIMIRERAR